MTERTLYGTSDPLGGLLSRWRARTVARLLGTGSLVDLACGDNRLVRHLGYGTGIDVTDFGADLVLESFSQLPFADASVGNVTILAALNYFDNPVAVLREVSRILQDDGVLVVTQLRKPLSAIWHRLRDRGLPRIAYSGSELASLLASTPLHIHSRRTFMFGLNQAFVIHRRAARQL